MRLTTNKGIVEGKGANGDDTPMITIVGADVKSSDDVVDVCKQHYYDEYDDDDGRRCAAVMISKV